MSVPHYEPESERGPRSDGGKWCCACGVWPTDENGMEECPVSRVRMQIASTPDAKGLSHLWAYGNHERAMRIWQNPAASVGEGE